MAESFDPAMVARSTAARVHGIRYLCTFAVSASTYSSSISLRPPKTPIRTDNFFKHLERYDSVFRILPQVFSCANKSCSRQTTALHTAFQHSWQIYTKAATSGNCRWRSGLPYTILSMAAARKSNWTEYTGGLWL